MGVIANGGEAAEPYLMQKISRAGQTVYEAKTKTTGRLLSEETAEALGKMMRGAVVNQYGAWQFGSLTVCAKSGTAERENGPADAMFAGFVEDEAYPLAFVVFAERRRLRQPDSRAHRRKGPCRVQDHAGYPEPERLSAWTAGRREKQSSAGKSMQPHKV